MSVRVRAVGEPNRRTAILNVAAELFARKGVAATTVREIADEAGILSGSLYHHFDSKEVMVEEIFTAYFDELTTKWDEILAQQTRAIDKFEAMFRAAVLAVDRHIAAARMFTNEWESLRHIGDFSDRWSSIEKLWLRVIRKAVSEGDFRSDVDPYLLYSFAIDSIRGLAGWYRENKRYPIDAVSDAYANVLLTGVAVSSPAKGAQAR
ncbi:MAG: TetR/AcrR family transcriptional regulator [Acidimicrobiales bacterium]